MNTASKLIIACGLAASLSACASTRQIDIATKPVEYTILQPAAPAPVSMNNVKIRVVTKDTLDAFIAEQVKLQGNANPVFVVMNVRDYQAMSLNLAELKRYIDQQKQIIIYYQKATAPKS